jgi:hypothetical protein
MPFDMVDADHGDTASQGQRLAGRQTDQQGAD